ncbi:MAG: aminotransferase class I/II-fold pyridoxal phosphate-dependent enzyme [Eubacteriales bacterium]
MHYTEYTKEEAVSRLAEAEKKHESQIALGLSLDLSRGKPAPEQLDLSLPMLSCAEWQDDAGVDCRNYGMPFGLAEMRRFWASVTGIPAERIVVGGNSSLQMMYETLTRAMLFGVAGSTEPWCKIEKRKFLCPAPGYDRHFRVTETLGFELVTVPMTQDGPDMDVVEALVKDPTVLGMWCVPKYSNPTGVTYSDETVTRIAAMETAAPDFTVMWDNAYAVHDFVEDGDHLLDVFSVAEKYGHEDRFFYFSSTSKITFPGAGVAMMSMSERNLAKVKPLICAETIGPDKLNQLRHLAFLPNKEALTAQMKRHAEYIRPKFDTLLTILERELSDAGYAQWTRPSGGYFVSMEVPDGCAKRVWDLCREAGLTLTDAGASFPYGRDPKDSNLRLAPTFCSLADMTPAAEILTTAVKIAALERLLA